MKEVEAKIEILAKDYENLISELKSAKMWDDGTIVEVTGTENGITYYMGYDSFRCFCDSLILKYLKKS